MISHVSHVPLLVRDQEEAKRWYTEKLGFEVRSDSPFPGNNEARWVTIGPKEQPNLEIVLQPAEWGMSGDPAERVAMIGKQPGWVVLTENCVETCGNLKEQGVKIISEPMEMPWGMSAVFEDLYGNQHNLVGPLPSAAENN